MNSRLLEYRRTCASGCGPTPLGDHLSNDAGERAAVLLAWRTLRSA